MYVVCGQGPLIEKHKAMAKRLGVEDRVIFAGYRDDVIDFYGMSDVFVFPSIREGLPVALLEALASGLPCVAAKNRGSVDLDIRNEYLFDANNQIEAKQAIEKALNSERLEDNNESIMQYDISNTLKIVKKLYLDE